MKFRLAAFADEADSRLDGQLSAMVENDVDYLEIRAPMVTIYFRYHCE